MPYGTVLQATSFAEQKHRGQTRKDRDGTPYIVHPISVAHTLADGADIDAEDVLAAALLHDTVEDTETNPAEIESEFGTSVADMVTEVTDNKSLPKLARKRAQIEHAPSLSRGAALIKLADKYSNVYDVIHTPPPSWDTERRVQYLLWSRQVIDKCPRVHDELRHSFGKLVVDGLKTILSESGSSLEHYSFRPQFADSERFDWDVFGNRISTLPELFTYKGCQHSASVSEERVNQYGPVDYVTLRESFKGQHCDGECLTRIQVPGFDSLEFEQIESYLVDDSKRTHNYSAKLQALLRSWGIDFVYEMAY